MTVPYLTLFLVGTPWFQSWYVLWILPLLGLWWPLGGTALLTAGLTLLPEAIYPLTASLLVSFLAFLALVGWIVDRKLKRLFKIKTP